LSQIFIWQCLNNYYEDRAVFCDDCACRNYAEDVADTVDYIHLGFLTNNNAGTHQLGRQVQKYNPFPFHSSARSWKFVRAGEVCVLLGLYILTEIVQVMGRSASSKSIKTSHLILQVL
jgi:hypothetical protein